MSEHSLRIRIVCLDSMTWGTEILPPALASQMIGGKALAWYAFLRYSDDLAPPLSASNALVFAVSPLTPVWPGSAAVCLTRSPLTGVVTDSVCTGPFGRSLARAGVDAIAVVGRSDACVFLHIDTNGVYVVDASPWRLDPTTDATHAIHSAFPHAEHASACVVGPAGVNGVSFASAIAETRAFGRGGIGAVMGSKNLKGVLLSGNTEREPFDSVALSGAIAQLESRATGAHPYRSYGELGTSGLYEVHHALGCLTSSNYRRPVDLSQLCYDTIVSRFDYQNYTPCAGCLVRCARRSRASGEEFEGTTSNGPEFETLWALGPHVGNQDPDLVIAAEQLCDELGMDTISAGSAVAFLLECEDRTLIAPQDNGLLHLLRQICDRIGVGEIMSRGVRKAAQQLGGGAKQFAMHVKGMELPAYDPRGFLGIALALSISSRGGCHRKAFCGPETRLEVPGLQTEGKSELVVLSEIRSAVLDSLSVCKWATLGLSTSELSAILGDVTGWSVTREDLQDTANKCVNLARLYSRKAGLSRLHDTLPVRFLREPGVAPHCHPAVDATTLDKLVHEYYSLRGWNREGNPDSTTLKRVFLQDGLDMSRIASASDLSGFRPIQMIRH